MYHNSIVCIAGRLFYRNENQFIDDENLIKQKISLFIMENNLKSNTTNTKKVLDILKMQNYTKEDEFFTHELWVVPFLNGYFNAITGTFRFPDEKKFFYCIPHKFEGLDHDCPRFKKMVGEWLLGQKGENPILPDDIFQIIGYLMTMNVNLKKAFYIFGNKHSGKSTFQNILLYLIGSDNRAEIDLNRMTKDQFGTDGLQLKILNMVGDMSSSTLKEFAYLKQLTGDDKEIAVEQKGKLKGKFINHVKMLFSGNKIPHLLDKHDDAFYDRWILINFANSFKVTQTPRYDHIINNPVEIRGIIAESMKALVKLYNRGGFRPEICDNIKHIWNYNSDNLYRFVHDRCELGSNNLCEGQSFVSAYCDYVFDNNLGRMLSVEKITNKLYQMRVSKKQKGDGLRYYHGIRLLTPDELLGKNKTEEEKIVKYEEIIEEYEVPDLNIPEEYSESFEEYCKRVNAEQIAMSEMYDDYEEPDPITEPDEES